MAEDRPVDIADVTAMIDLLRESGWTHARLRMGDFELELSDGAPDTPATLAAAPAPAAAPTPVAAASAADPAPALPADAPQEAAEIDGVVVRAQSIGIFWRSPQPGAPPFVEVGDEVDADSPLGIVEVMKMMTRIQPGVRGTVVAIHVGNGDVVEFDQPLVTIRPA